MKSRFISRGWSAAVLAAAFVMSTRAGAAGTCPSRDIWPTQGWTERKAEVAAARADEIKALEDYAFTLVGTDAQRIGIRTDSVVIIKGGQLIYEKYARGYDETKRHIGWSVTKSVTSALTGIAANRGLLSVDDSICKYLSAENQKHCDITVRNLLEFSSGLDWTEFYEYKSNQASSVLAMLYGQGRKDTVAFVTGLPSRDPVGTTFEYSTGEALLLSNVVQGAMKPSLGETYPWTVLFAPLGMKSAMIERDTKGNYLGGSHFYATPRDMAKFGYMYLNDGCWEGQRLLPDGWVKSSTTVQTPFRTKVVDPVALPEGWMWWLNQGVPEQNIPDPPLPGVPGDTFMARGHWGQSISVIPSLDLVIVRTGDDRDETKFTLKTFLPLAIAVAR